MFLCASAIVVLWFQRDALIFVARSRAHKNYLVSQLRDNFRRSWTCYFYVWMRLNNVVLCTRMALAGVIACTAFLDGNVSARCNRRHLRRQSFIWCLSSSYRYCKIFGLPSQMNHKNGRAHCEFKTFVPVQSTINGGELLALHISFVIRGGSSTQTKTMTTMTDLNFLLVQMFLGMLYKLNRTSITDVYFSADILCILNIHRCGSMSWDSLWENGQVLIQIGKVLCSF